MVAVGCLGETKERIGRTLKIFYFKTTVNLSGWQVVLFVVALLLVENIHNSQCLQQCHSIFYNDLLRLIRLRGNSVSLTTIVNYNVE